MNLDVFSMNFFTDTLQYRIHALVIFLLCVYLTLAHSLSRLSIGVLACLFVLPIAISIFSTMMDKNSLSFGNSLTLPDLVVLLSTWTALNIISFQTTYPPVSIRNFPDLHLMFPVLFIAGLLLITWLFAKSDGNLLSTAIITIALCVMFPYTRPLDNHPLAYAIPIFIGSYTLHRNSKNLKSILAPRMMLILSMPILVFIINLDGYFKSDYEQIVPKLLLTLLIIILLVVFRLASYSNLEKTIQLFRTVTFFHVLLLTVFTLAWMGWMSLTLGISSVVKYRLWLSLIHPNALAVYLGLSLFVLAPWLEKGTFRLFSWTIASSLILMLILTQSRGGILAFSLITLLYFLTKKNECQEPLSAKRKLFLISAVCLTITILWNVRYRLLNTGMIQDRFGIWKPAWTHIKNSPLIRILFGQGFCTKATLQDTAIEMGASNRFLDLWLTWDRLGQHFHNLPIEILWMGGVTAFLASVIIISIAFRSNKKPMKHELKAALAFLLISGMVDCAVYYPAIFFLSIAIIGCLVFPDANLRSSADCLNKKSRDSIAVLSLILFLILEIGLIGSAIRTDTLNTACSYYSSLGAHQISKTLGMKAANRHPPSLQALSIAASEMIRNNECQNAIQTLLHHSKNKKDLRRLSQWIIDTTDMEFQYESGHAEDIIHGLIFDKNSRDFWVRRLILSNPDTYQFFQKCISSSDESLVITRRCLLDWLELRGITPGDCLHPIPVIEINMETHLSNLQQDMVSSPEQYTLNQKENFVRCVMIRGDFRRAVALAGAWKITLNENMMQKDIKTFKDGSSDYALKQAEKALNQGQFEIARQHLESARLDREGSSQWYRLHGLYLLHSYEWIEALSSLNRSLELEPGNIETQVAIGECYYYLNQYDAALTIFETTLRTVPWSIKSHNYLGLIYLDNRNFIKAHQHLQIVADTIPDSLWAQLNVFQCLKHLPGRAEDAEGMRIMIVSKFDLSSLPDDVKSDLDKRVHGR